MKIQNIGAVLLITISITLVVHGKKYGKGFKSKVDLGQKYCNTYVNVTDSQSKALLECHYHKKGVSPAMIDECAGIVFPPQNQETSYQQLRKAICDRESKLYDFHWCCTQKNEKLSSALEHKCHKHKSQKDKMRCFSKEYALKYKCYAEALKVPAIG